METEWFRIALALEIEKPLGGVEVVRKDERKRGLPEHFRNRGSQDFSHPVIGVRRDSLRVDDPDTVLLFAHIGRAVAWRCRDYFCLALDCLGTTCTSYSV